MTFVIGVSLSNTNVHCFHSAMVHSKYERVAFARLLSFDEHKNDRDASSSFSISNF